MSQRSLLEEVKITNWANNSAAGQTDVIPATRLDMNGWDGLLVIIKVGTINATGTVDATIRHSDTDAAGVKTTLTAALTAADDDEIIALQAIDPEKRFIDLIVERGTADSEVDSILAIQFRGSGPLPVTQAAGINTASAVRPATA